MKKALAFALSLIMAASMVGCGSAATTGSSSSAGASAAGASAASAQTSAAAGAAASTTTTTTTADGKTKLTVGIYGGLDSLNPWSSGRITKDMVTYVMYETLAGCQSGSTKLENILMKDYKQVDDSTVDVTLYDNITDVEGNKITAADVVFSFEQYAKNWAVTYDSVKAVDDSTVELHFTTTAQGTFDYVACKVPIASEAAFKSSKDQFASTCCGTMPYKVSDYEAGTKIVLEKTDKYWQSADLTYKGSVANADIIEFDIIEEESQMALALQKGTIQMAMYVLPDMLDEVSGYTDIATASLPSSEDRGIMFCMTESSPFYNNLKLRQAVLYAIDNQSVADACGYGYATPSTLTCGNKDLTIGYDDTWNCSPYAYDPEKAKELVKESGYNGQTIRLLANTNGTITTMWQIVQAELQEVGITAELNVCEGTTYGAYRDGTQGQYELAYAGPGNGGYVTQDLWNTLFNRNNYSSGRTWAGLLDDTLQEKYDKLATKDGYTQANIDDFYKYITDNAYYYEIYNLPDYVAYNKTAITGYYQDQNRFIRANTIELK
jgi:peptide/nickel transport system substrate-binding protein